MAYNLRRERPKVNYKALLEEKLPKVTGGRVSRQADKLYPMEVVETDGSKVKIHYVGYADHHDGGGRQKKSSPSTHRCARKQNATLHSIRTGS